MCVGVFGDGHGGKIGMGMLSHPGIRAWLALITDEIRDWRRM